MSKFSDRYFNVDASSFFQEDSMNDELRNSLYNSIHQEFLLPLRRWSNASPKNSKVKNFFHDYYDSFLKEDLYGVKVNVLGLTEKIYFFLRRGEWYRIYDFIEFLVQWVGRNIGNDPLKVSSNTASFSRLNWHSSLVSSVNRKLKRESSVFRVVGDHVLKVTEGVEVDEINYAIGDDNPYEGAKTHLKTSLQILSDREQKNYRNSVKESISAIESLARSVCRKDKGTLGELLKEMEKKGIIPSAMKSAYSKIYGFSSDASGIRHSLTDSDRPISYADAKYMLVVCSAFTGYVIEVMEK